MGKRNGNEDPRPPVKSIELVCVSTHGDGRPPADAMDELRRVDGLWAWCPRGGRRAHRWQAVTAGSLDAVRDQLAELSRLVGVALAIPAKPARPSGRVVPAKRRWPSTKTKRTR